MRSRDRLGSFEAILARIGIEEVCEADELGAFAFCAKIFLSEIWTVYFCRFAVASLSSEMLAFAAISRSDVMLFWPD